MSKNLFLSIWRRIQLPSKQIYFFSLLTLFLVQSTVAFSNASSTMYFSNSSEYSSTNILNTNYNTARAENRIMSCTGTATVVSNNGVDNAAAAAGTSDGSYAELHQGGDAIVLDLGEPLAAATTITVFFRRISTGDPDWTIGSSSTTSGFSGVPESPVNLSFVSSGTASTFTITVPAGDQYVEIVSDGIDADLDAFEFTCPILTCTITLTRGLDTVKLLICC